MASLFSDLDDDVPSQCLLTEEIWDKFQFSIFSFPVEMPNLDNEIDLESIEFFANSPGTTTTSPDGYEIRNHDCMWAGHCGSKEHSHDEVRNVFVKSVPPMYQHQNHHQHHHNPHQQSMHSAPSSITSQPSPANTIKQPPQQIAPGRSLLLKTQPQHQQQMHMQQQQQQQTTFFQQNCINNLLDSNTMQQFESPPNSDDEESKSEMLKYLQDAISECDMDDDDLYDYFVGNKGFIADEEFEENEKLDAVQPKEEPEENFEESPIVSTNTAGHHNTNTTNSPTTNNSGNGNTNNKTYNRSATISQFVNDHSYYKDKNASMRNLGLETPSDSEEEIDVVSTDDKLQQNNQRTVGGALPTNPTTRDRQQLQKTVASAITKNGILTIQPRKPISVDHSPNKRRQDGRGIKRQRHSPYKKQRTFNSNNQMSSDSEQEPTEKRIEHNNMERQRRIDLRNAFEELRVLVPEVSSRERAPKVVILREAALYCHRLTDLSESIRDQVEDMRRDQRKLRARLSNLRLSLASKHR